MTGTETDTRDAGAPEDVDELVVSTNGGQDRKFHVPAGDEGTETLCRRTNSRGKHLRKPVEVYPRGWLEWCDECLETYRGER